MIRESDEDQCEDGTQPMDDDQDLLACQTTTPVVYTWSDTAMDEDGDKSNSSRRSDDSDSSDDDSVEILEPHQKLNAHRRKKEAGRKPSSKRAGRAGKGNDSSEESDIGNDYDPDTCGTYTATH